METLWCGTRFINYESFEPTYKEWKPFFLQVYYPTGVKFWAYLQGMETWEETLSHNEVRGFWAYLQGMETELLFEGFEYLREFWAYLQGMETMAEWIYEGGF